MNKRILYSVIIAVYSLSGCFSGACAQTANLQAPVAIGTASINYPGPEIMPAVNVDSLMNDDVKRNEGKNQPYRFGYNHLVNLNTQNSGLWTQAADGSRVWLLDIKSPGAVSINLAFSNFNLPAHASMFVYGKNKKQILGPYTSDNKSPDGFFGTELLRGDEIIVEYDVPAGAAAGNAFNLFRVTHGYRDLQQVLRGYETPFPCTNNVNCPQYGAYTNQKRSVVCIITGGGEICSGAVINDALNDGTPYVLTANHCGTADGTWTFRFNYETPYCENTDSTPVFESLTGATPVANSTLSDFNLIKINNAIPASYHAFYSGWSRSALPATNVTCIHHPEGEVKKCSQSANAVSDTVVDAGNGPAACWTVNWTDGVTAPGSSGSPLYDQNKHIIGQLYAGVSACTTQVNQQIDFYGQFSISWDSGSTSAARLRDWLDPNNSNPASNDGFDPNPPTDSLDLAIVQILSPSGDSLCGNFATPVIGLLNMGSSTIHFATISYQVDGGADSVFTFNDSIVYYQPLEVSLPPIYFTGSGSHSLTVQVSQPNGLPDENPSNNSLTATFFQYNAAGSITPFKEGFEENSFPPNGWAITIPASGTTWQQDTVGAYGGSSFSAMVNEFSPSTSTAGEIADLISPEINTDSLTPPAYLVFDVAYAGFDSIAYDSLQVLVSGDCGISWQTIYAKGGNLLATAPDTLGQFIPAPNQWRTDSIIISNWIGLSAVQFDFRLISGYGNVLYLDNVRVPDSSHAVSIAKIIDDNMHIQLFPNPFYEEFTIRVNLPEPAILNAALYSIDGKMIQPVLNRENAVAGENKFVINAAGISPGLYFLKLNNAVIKVEKM